MKRHKLFHESNPLYLLQWPIEPSRGDAKICFMWCYVMDTMMSPRQNDVMILQEQHPLRETPVGV